MIPASDPKTSATPQATSYAPPAQTIRRPGEADLPEPDHVAQLSAMVSYLRALQGHYRADHRLAGRARDAAARVQALAHTLTNATVAQPERCPTPPATGPSPQTSLTELETAFERWLANPTATDEIQLDDHEPSPQPLREVLEALRASRRPLPGETAATLGLPTGTTTGQAATELARAVEDPEGPRCRSYRAAAYYLRDLDRIALATNEVEKALP